MNIMLMGNDRKMYQILFLVYHWGLLCEEINDGSNSFFVFVFILVCVLLDLFWRYCWFFFSFRIPCRCLFWIYMMLFRVQFIFTFYFRTYWIFHDRNINCRIVWFWYFRIICCINYIFLFWLGMSSICLI